jgi:hypothetical protein
MNEHQDQGRAPITVTETFRGDRVTWTARHNRKVIATVTRGQERGMWDSDPLTVAIGAHFGITADRVHMRPKPVRFYRKGTDSHRIVPRLAEVDTAAGLRPSTPRCSSSGTRISQAALRDAEFVSGSGWLARCPECGQTPGSRADGHVLMYADHEVAPTCVGCLRPAVGWPVSQPDVCSPEDWIHCTRDPHVVASENATLAAAQAAEDKTFAEAS